MRALHVHLLIIAAVATALLVTTGCGSREPSPEPPSAQQKAETVESATAPSETAAKEIPKLLDLGAHKCIPCKKMAPILEDLSKNYEGRMDVEFIDVWQNPEAGNKYGIRSIPTQIFFGFDGKELFRHVGFYSKEDIMSKWEELGYTFSEADGEQ